MKSISSFIPFLIVLFVMGGCMHPEARQSHSPFHPKVSAFTSGDISNVSVIMVQFADSVKMAVAGGQVPKGLLSFEPAIQGKGVWSNPRTIVFNPRSPLPSNTSYEAKINLKGIFPEEDDAFFFSFKTIAQNIRFRLEGFEPESSPVGEKYRISVKATLADHAPATEVEKVTRVFLDGESLVPVWSHSDEEQHLLKIEVPRIKKKSRHLVIKAKKGAFDSANSGELEIQIPALGSFELLRANMEYGSRKSIKVVFSDPIARDQDLGGLFILGEEKDLVYTVENNVVRLFPGENLSGERRLRVLPGIKSESGLRLEGGGEFIFAFSSLKPEVRILGHGNIMPWSDGLYLPFKTVSLKRIKVRVIKIFEQNVGHFLQINDLDGQGQLKRAGRLVHTQTIDLNQDQSLNLRGWNTFSLELSKFIAPDPGAIYRIEMGFDQEDAIYPCDEEEDAGLKEKDVSVSVNGDEAEFWDNPNDYYSTYPYRYNPDYNWRDRDNPCSSSYYTRRRWVFRNVLASNLGLVAKRGEGHVLSVVVNDIRTTEPLPEAEVKVFDLQMKQIANGVTDKEGKVDLDCQGMPFLLIAGLGNQRGYLRLDNGRSLSVDRFDVSGENVKKGLKGFIFGERGVWRPGDSLFVSFMPMMSGETVLPQNHPVTFELMDPRGRLVRRQVERSMANQLYTFRCKTDEDAPTGLWQARVILGGVAFEKNLRIEAIRPNRLKIQVDFPHGDRLRAGQNIDFNLSSNWLHGSPASNLKSDVQINIKRVPTRFEGYHGYIFDDPTRRFVATEQMLFEGVFDDAGKTRFAWQVPRVKNAPGLLRGIITSRVFEAAGTFSVDHKPVTISPYSSYLGIRVPEGDDRGMLLTDTTHTLEVVAVNDEGKPVSVKGVKYTIYKIDWRWWWEKTDEDLGRFISSGSHKVVDSGSLDVLKGKASIPFRINRPDWGRYLVRLENPASGHSTAGTLMVDWPGWARDSGDPGAASLLSFKADKPVYRTGEKITVNFPSSTEGRALVSVENGSRLIKSWWIKPDGKQTSFSFEATAEMTPNIYVSITLLQPHGQSSNNRPVRMFGVIPVMVEDPAMRLSPVLKTTDQWRPGHKEKVEITEKNGKAMDYVVAIVDEGLLDLTRYKTPDPWMRFNAREALGVKTWDLYDQVLGTFGGKIERLFSIGGDQALLDPEGQNRMRRFEPMVRFLGPCHLNKGEKKIHSLTVPDYTGSVRVMGVAIDGRAAGSTEQTVTVKQPLMVWSAMPRLMGPNEKVLLPVTVFSMDDKIRGVEVAVKSSAHFKVLGESEQEVVFYQQGEKTIFFEMETLQLSGKARVEIIARGAGERASRIIPIEIRMPNPPKTQKVSAILEPNGETFLGYSLPGVKGTNSAVLEVSSVPALNLAGRLKYLLDYPHGCVEQVVSGAFPQLFLGDVVALNSAREKKARENVSGVLERLSAYQTRSGGFAYWPGQSQENDWNSSYAGHFFLQAEKKGYFVSPSLRSKWLSFQKRRASLWLPAPGTKTYPYEQMLQAYRLYTLALAGASDRGSMNRLRQQKGLVIQTRWLLASAYVLAGLPEVAEDLMSKISGNEKMGTQPYTYGSPLRDRALLVEALLATGRRQEAMLIVREMVQALNSEEWYSTQTTAFGLMAVVSFFDDETGNLNPEFSYRLNDGADITVGTDKPVFQTFPELEQRPEGTISLRNRTQKELFVTLTMTGVPGGIDKTLQRENLIIRSGFLTMDDEKLDPLSIRQGTDFKYVIQVQNPGTLGDANHLALSQMVPSGWEIRNLRMEGNTTYEIDQPDYRDIRDDRVYSYFDLPAGASRQFLIVCHAAFAGLFYLPPVSCQAMYDDHFQARLPGKITEVMGERSMLGEGN